MDNQFFLNHLGMPLPPPPPPLQFDHPTMPTWQSLSSSSSAAAAMDIHMMTIPSSSSDHLFAHQSSPDHCFFDSALSSMVSSPTTTNTNTNTNVNGFAIKELIGRLGNIYTGPGAGDSPPSSSAAAAVIVSSCNNSCYSTPLSSPKMVQQHQQSNVADHFPAPANYSVVGGNTLLPAMPGDPGFAERAARFSSFGSRSFNGRTTTTPTTTTINNGIMSPPTGGVSGSGSGFPPKSPGGIGGGPRGAKLQRVLSSPSLKVANHNHNNNNNHNNGTTSTVHEGEAFTTPDRKTSRFGGQFGNSREENGDVVAVVRGSSSRKRKSSSSSAAAAVQKGKEEQQKENCSDAKRCKEKIKTDDDEKARVEEVEEEEDISNKKKQSKSNNTTTNKDDSKQKKIIDEAPKDYIHVRARRGQATDSHSLAERVRREKISERMKLLQDLVPGCNKVVGKALMLEEIINYVQSLQRQVEFLSMKLATVNPRMEFNTDSDNANANANSSVFRKDPEWSMQHLQQHQAAAGGGSSYPMTQSGYGGHGHHQSLQQQQLHYHQQQQSVVNIEIPMEILINNNNNGFTTTDHRHHTVVPEEQLPSLCEGDDLEAIVEMGRRLISTHSTTTTTDVQI